MDKAFLGAFVVCAGCARAKCPPTANSQRFFDILASTQLHTLKIHHQPPSNRKEEEVLLNFDDSKDIRGLRIILAVILTAAHSIDQTIMVKLAYENEDTSLVSRFVEKGKFGRPVCACSTIIATMAASPSYLAIDRVVD